MAKRQADKDLGQKAAGERLAMPAITQTRIRAGLTQPELAEVFGVSLETVQEWEQGRSKPPATERALLAVAERQPDVLRDLWGALHER